MSHHTGTPPGLRTRRQRCVRFFVVLLLTGAGANTGAAQLGDLPHRFLL